MPRPCWLLLLVAIWAGFASPIPAQTFRKLKPSGLALHNSPPPPPVGGKTGPNPAGSHFPLPDVVPPDNLDELLSDRLRQLQNLRDSHALAQKYLKNNDLLKQFNLKPADLEKFRRMVPQDPELLKLVEKYRDNPGALAGLLDQSRVSPEEMALFQKLAEKFKKQLSTTKLDLPGGNTPPIHGDPPIETFGGGFKSVPDLPREPSTSERWQEFLTKQMDWLANGLDGLDRADDSQALRDALRQLNRIDLGDQGPNLGRFTRGQMETFDHVARWLSPDQLGAVDWSAWLGRDWKFRLPALRSLPSVSLPSFNAPSWSSRMPSAPPLPAAPSGNAWVWMLLLVLMALLLWKWSPWFKAPEDATQSGQWHLGPWPVAPDQVTTRGELVRTFEYLALLLLGPVARTHNHRDLAGQIGGQAGETPARREVVEQLARLYEKARYAPEQADVTVPLSQDEQTFARHALCLLAGLNPA